MTDLQPDSNPGRVDPDAGSLEQEAFPEVSSSEANAPDKASIPTIRTSASGQEMRQHLRRGEDGFVELECYLLERETEAPAYINRSIGHLVGDGVSGVVDAVSAAGELVSDPAEVTHLRVSLSFLPKYNPGPEIRAGQATLLLATSDRQKAKLLLRGFSERLNQDFETTFHDGMQSLIAVAQAEGVTFDRLS